MVSRKRLLYFLAIPLLLTAILLSACSSSATTSSAPGSSSSIQSPTTTLPPTTRPVTPATSAPVTSANWWDKLGQPQYGGTITYGVNMVYENLDPLTHFTGVCSLYLESMWISDWTTDRGVWPFTTGFLPDEFAAGNLVKTWEMTDATTLVAHLQQGVHWQNKPPVNGREFTADDVQQHYDRILGNGSGYTTPSAIFASRYPFLEKVTALDKYTVQFKYKYVSVAQAFGTMTNYNNGNAIEPPELVKNGINDWHNANGTGPWMLTDYAAGTSITLTKNPNYWGHDERYPENQIPYADQLKVAIIPDDATRVAAIRTGKIDYMDTVGWQDAQAIAKTDPELLQWPVPLNSQVAALIVARPPFSDLKVRTAMNMAIDRKGIAQSLFGGIVDGSPCGIAHPVMANAGWGFAYNDWPQSLKDEFAYNPAGAKALLAEAGYPDGFDTTMQAPSSGDQNLMMVFKSNWADIGVNVDIQLIEANAYTPLAFQKKLDHIAWNQRGGMGGTVVPQNLLNLFQSKDLSNFAMVNDPTWDGFVTSFAQATSIDEAKQIFKEADKYELEQHWLIGACPIYTYTITQPYLKGYSGELVTGPDATARAWMWSRMWIDKAAKTAMGR